MPPLRSRITTHGRNAAGAVQRAMIEKTLSDQDCAKPNQLSGALSPVVLAGCRRDGLYRHTLCRSVVKRPDII